MDFELSEELKMVRSLARDFVTNELRPLERDLLGRSADLSDAQVALAPEVEANLIRKARDVGLWASSVPEELGGVGLGTLANCLIQEELAQTVVPFDFGDVSPILFDCDESQRSRYLTPILNHEKTLLIALVEPAAHADQKSGADTSARRALQDAGLGPVPSKRGQSFVRDFISARARKEGSRYVLNGVKTVRSKLAPSVALVFALTNGTGPTCFLVDAGTPGYDIQIAEHGPAAKIPMLLRFRECIIPEANRLGDEGKAFSLGREWLPARRIVRGARAVGVARRLLEEATTRAATTQSFGQAASNQLSVRAALAEIAVAIHACRLVVHEAAWKSDEGKTVKNEASMVKVFAAQMIRNVSDRVAHIYGGPSATAARLSDSVATASSIELAVELQRDIVARQILKGLRV